MRTWKAALAAAVATAVVALIVIAPMAQSSRSHPGLKVATAHSSGQGGVIVRCPRGFIPIAGGFDSVDGSATTSQRVSKRSWEVVIDAPSGGVTGTATCVKGTGGFRLEDLTPPAPPPGRG